MGVTGLLRHVRTRRAHVREFAGRGLAIDMSCWIHRGLYRGNYMIYIQRYVNMLLRHGCKLAMVFDGKPPSAKREALLARRREPSTHSITEDVVAAIVSKFASVDNVRIVHSPGEADPQLAYLARERYVAAVVTEDSDLIVFGCAKILFKMTPWGWCRVYERPTLPVGWNIFRWSCILAGCDYLRGGFKGMGLKKAAIFLNDNDERRDDMLRRLGADPDFVAKFQEADDAFLYQNVYDPLSGDLLCLYVFYKIFLFDVKKNTVRACRNI